MQSMKYNKYKPYNTIHDKHKNPACFGTGVPFPRAETCRHLILVRIVLYGFYLLYFIECIY